jgi:hypothetical protein
MKKFILISFLAFSLVISLSADDKVFRSLQFSAVLSINLDTMLTYDAIWNYGAKERNPAVAAYIDNLPLTLGIDTVLNMTLIWGTNKIYKKNKTLAYAIVIGVNLIQAYCFYTHHRLRHQSF